MPALSLSHFTRSSTSSLFTERPPRGVPAATARTEQGQTQPAPALPREPRSSPGTWSDKLGMSELGRPRSGDRPLLSHVGAWAGRAGTAQSGRHSPRGDLRSEPGSQLSPGVAPTMRIFGGCLGVWKGESHQLVDTPPSVSPGPAGPLSEGFLGGGDAPPRRCSFKQPTAGSEVGATAGPARPQVSSISVAVPDLL